MPYDPAVSVAAREGAGSAHVNHATPRLRRGLVRLLGLEAGGDGASAEDLAAASGRLLDRLSQQLSQVVGDGGVTALLLRAVNLSRREFPFLDARIVAVEGEGSRGELLRTCLRKQEAEDIRKAAVTLFATVVGLVVTLVGEKLAWSLLREVWPAPLRSEAAFEENEEWQSSAGCPSTG